MNSVYITVLNAPYLPRALALYESLLRYNQHLQFAFYCMDGISADILSQIDLRHGHVFREAEFATDALLSLRNERSVSEYCQSAKAFAICHMLKTNPDVDWVVFVDADCLAFGNLDVALQDAADADFLVTPHYFANEFLHFAPIVGRYNSGYFACKSTSIGKAVAVRWRDLCIEACPAVPTPEAYTDQKYLERLLAEFSTGTASLHIGLNTAPWNIGRYHVDVRQGRVFVDDAPLLLYHFQALRILSKNWIDLYFGNMKLGEEVSRAIYSPYLAALSEAYAKIQNVAEIDNLGMKPLPAEARSWLSYGKKVLVGASNLRRYALVKT